MKESGEKVEVRNFNVPGWRGRVDAQKYRAMESALMRILPRTEPGLTQTEMRNKVVFHLSAHVFEDSSKIAWWAKCVQQDLEARGVIEREKQAKPLRWHRV
jgi:hypothetical protein